MLKSIPATLKVTTEPILYGSDYRKKRQSWKTPRLLIPLLIAVLTVVVLTTVLSVQLSRRGGSKSPHTQASLVDTPAQIHISQGDRDGEAIVVSWVTSKVTSGIVIVNRVGYPNDTQVFDQSEPAQSYTYPYNPTASYTSPLIHFVNVTGLLPTVLYEYQCGDAQGGFSEKHIMLPWGSSPQSQPFTLLLVGDLGQTEDSKKTRDQMMKSGVANAPVILVGDLSYADSEGYPGVPFYPCDQKRWDSWGEMMQPLLSTNVLMTCPGNHEKEYNGLVKTQEKFQAYLNRFRMPSLASGATEGNLYYSFNVPFAHLVMLNSYDGESFSGPYGTSTKQYQWLKKDLESVDRSRYPWLIVTMHAPWYNSNTAHQDEVQEVDMRTAMEDLLYEHKVDIVFAGHVHAYERMYAVFKNVTTADAPIYINIGDGGNREGPARDYLEQPSWSAFRQATFGHGRFTMHNSTHAFWTWHRNSDNSQIYKDQVWLVKNTEFGTKSAGVRAVNEDMSEPRQYDGFYDAKV